MTINKPISWNPGKLQDEEIALLKDQINILKGEKRRPIFKGNKLDKNTRSDHLSKPPTKKRSSKKSKDTKAADPLKIRHNGRRYPTTCT
jgi:hypothetical protein